MKKTGLLNVQLSAVVAGMGHGDLLVIADAGLPIPPGVTCVDLAVRPGTPPFLEVLDAVLGELQVERFVLAEELLARDAALPAAIRARLPEAAEDRAPHEEFKRLTARARAIVRTGECTPYSNVILASGVTF